MIDRAYFFKYGPTMASFWFIHCKVYNNNDYRPTLNRSIYDKITLLTGHISAHDRESWVGIALASWLNKVERLVSSRRQLLKRMSLGLNKHACLETYTTWNDNIKLPWWWLSGYHGGWQLRGSGFESCPAATNSYLNKSLEFSHSEKWKEIIGLSNSVRNFKLQSCRGRGGVNYITLHTIDDEK